MAYLDRGSTTGYGRHADSEGDASWAELAKTGKSKSHRYQEHEAVYYEGDPADKVYEVVEGTVMLFKLLPDGRRQVVEVLRTGGLFGLTSKAHQDCNAETLTASVIRSIEKREIEGSTVMQQHIAKCMLTQLETLHDHAVLLGRKSAFERVASFLMRFVPERGIVGCIGPKPSGKDESLIVLAMTRQEIADYLGLTIETVSRVISDLKRRGLITIEKQDRIRITNVCGICHLTGTH
ncbi:MAG: helix-turn-helix domain-containing protein [Hyphomicrobiaceae bacterium]|nr:helix-turn-helix domain-containing protein [Hyphomicrobiaceae bacterium]